MLLEHDDVDELLLKFIILLVKAWINEDMLIMNSRK